MKHRSEPITIAIIGGGVTGRLLTAQALQSKADGPLRIFLIDRDSAPADDCVDCSAPVKPKAIDEQRKAYADYCTFVLNRAIEEKRSTTTLTRLSSEAVSIVVNETETKGQVTLKNGKVIEADRIVLAVGSLDRMKNGAQANQLRRVRDVLISDLRNRLLLSAAPGRFAVATNETGEIIDATGKVCPIVYAAGSIRYAGAWRAMSIKAMYEEMRNLAGYLVPAKKAAETAVDMTPVFAPIPQPIHGFIPTVQ